MLSQSSISPTLAVKDLKLARDFYEKKLGLKLTGEEADTVQFYECGPVTIEVYKSEFAGTNKATALTFEILDDIDSEVNALRNKGVEFEHYSGMPQTKIEGDVHIMPGMKAAWFKDPDGNILCLHQNIQ